MKETTTVIVRTQFEGLHCYPEAPEEVSYLRNMHRHIFNIEVQIETYHDDRELEFIMVKHRIDECLKDFEGRISCEQIAKYICNYLIKLYGERRMECKVFEDNENGGCVKYGF